MRQIKFRAWNTNLKKMLLSVGILQDNDYVSVIYQDLPNAFTKKRVLFHPEKTKCDIVLMQYTGLKDNDGKEIYEGDIIRNYKNEMAEIKCHQEIAGFLLKWLDSIKNESVIGKFVTRDFLISKSKIEKEEITIIGNIYENPGLLKLDD